MRLVLHCGGPASTCRASKIRKCRHSMRVPFGISLEDLRASIAQHGWIVSLVKNLSDPITNEPSSSDCDILCDTCAKIIYGDLYAQALVRMKTGAPMAGFHHEATTGRPSNQ